MIGMALFASVLCFGITSCGDDEVIPEKGTEPEEEEVEIDVEERDMTINGNNGVIEFHDHWNNPPYATHFSLVESKQITLYSYYVPDPDLELFLENYTLDYDSKYLKVEMYDAEGTADRCTHLVFHALAGTNGEEIPVTINYSYEGKKYKNVFYVTVTSLTEDEKDTQRRLEIKKYWFDQEKYESPVDLTTIKPVDIPVYLETDNGVMVLTSKSVDVNQETKEFYTVNDTHIYPGSIVYINKKLADGTPEKVSLPVMNSQGTVTVYMNFLAGSGKKSSMHGVKNEKSAIIDAINTLLSEALENGSIPPSEVKKHQSVSNSIEKMAVDLNLSTNFLSTKCDIKTNTSTASEKFYKLDTFNQSFYSIEVEPENADPTNYFGTGVTLQDIKNAEAQGGKIGIIKAVHYGRTGFYCREYESSKFSFVGSDSISYTDKFSGDSKQDIQSFCTSTKEYGSIFGGNPSTAAEAMDNDSVFMKKMLSNPVVSLQNQGKPIYYIVEYIGSGHEAKCSQTGKVNDVKEYQPAPNTLNLDMYNHAGVVALTKLWMYLDYSTFKFVNGKKVTVKSNERYEFGFGDRGRNQRCIELPKGEYFEKLANIKLVHQHAFGSPSMTSSSGKIWIADGFLKLCIQGSCYVGQDDPYLKDGCKECGSGCDVLWIGK